MGLQIPLARLLLETDSPDALPKQYIEQQQDLEPGKGGQHNHPANIRCWRQAVRGCVAQHAGPDKHQTTTLCGLTTSLWEILAFQVQVRLLLMI